MKRKLVLLAVFTVLLLGVVTTSAYAGRLSYAVDCLAQSYDMVVSAKKGQDMIFSEEQFCQALGIKDFEVLTVTSLPQRTEGVLKLGDVEVAKDQSISSESIGRLRLSPAQATTEQASFTFTCDSYCGGAEVKCTVRFSDSPNTAPSAGNASDGSLYVQTQKNITVFGSMSGSDPEGDSLTYQVVSYPKRGSLEVLDASMGDFRYTPRENFRGRDSFSYVVRDSWGNYSDVATVSITVGRRVIDVTYDDMEGQASYHAALHMQAQGVMQGVIEGDGYYFHPEQTVRRADFVVMAMKALGIRPDNTLCSTFFDDNDQIRASEMSYIATAQKRGYITGDYTGKELVFQPDEAITGAEAAVILTRMMGLRTEGAVATFSDGQSIPVWARESVACLYRLGIWTRASGAASGAAEELTRGQVAMTLLAAQSFGN